MGKADYLALGDWNATCFRCGRKFKASQLRKHWQGFYVCERDWEPRHPQDFVRAVGENITPPWSQPEPADVFLENDFISVENPGDNLNLILTESGDTIELET